MVLFKYMFSGGKRMKRKVGKKLLSVALTGIMALSVAACGYCRDNYGWRMAIRR